jgi:hypothetical protein
MVFFLIIPLPCDVASFLVSIKMTVITGREFPVPGPVYDASAVGLHSVNIQNYEGKGGVTKQNERKCKDPY